MLKTNQVITSSLKESMEPSNAMLRHCEGWVEVSNECDLSIAVNMEWLCRWIRCTSRCILLSHALLTDSVTEWLR